MTVKELTIRIPNQAGQLSRISELMGQAGVNIVALFVSTETPGGDGLMRFVPDNPERALNALATHDIEVTTQEVVAAETPHHAGGLLAILNPLKRAGVNVHYLYPCIQTGQSTILILGAGDQTGEAARVLQAEWIKLYGEELYGM